MSAEAATAVPTPAPITPATAPATRLLLFGLLGFSAGLPFYMFSTVLSLRLTDAWRRRSSMIGFFAWVQLLPTFKFALGAVARSL